jgi:hypothetical protein
MALIERKISIQDKVPVLLRDDNGDPVTGIAHGDVTLKYRKYGQTSLTTKTIDATNWFEVSDGLYDVLFTSAEFNTLKEFTFIVNATGVKQQTMIIEIIPEEKSEAKTAIDSLLGLLTLNQFKVNEYQSYTYDGQGRVSTITLKMGSDVAPTSTWLISFTYDANNNVTDMDVVKQ